MLRSLVTSSCVVLGSCTHLIRFVQLLPTCGSPRIIPGGILDEQSALENLEGVEPSPLLSLLLDRRRY